MGISDKELLGFCANHLIVFLVSGHSSNQSSDNDRSLKDVSSCSSSFSLISVNVGVFRHGGETFLVISSYMTVVRKMSRGKSGFAEESDQTHLSDEIEAEKRRNIYQRRIRERNKNARNA